MSARPTHDLCIKTGEYQDGSGQTKGRWLTIGAVFKHDDGGTSIKLDCIPVGLEGWKGWVSVFPRTDDREQPQQPRQGQQAQRGTPGPAAGRAPSRQQAPAGFDDDIPF